MFPVNRTRRLASRSGRAISSSSEDFSNCGWNCLDNAWDNSDCPTNDDIKCVCEDMVARKQASTCISNRCSASDVNQFSLAVGGCNDDVADPIPTTHQPPPTPSPTAEPTTALPTQVTTFETSPSPPPSTSSEAATIAAPPETSTTPISSPSITSVGSGAGDGSLSDSDIPPTSTWTRGTALSGSATQVLGSSHNSSSTVSSISSSRGTSSVAPPTTTRSDADTLPSSSSTTSGSTVSSPTQSVSTPRGISSQVLIGLSAGLGVVLLMITVAVFFLCRRRRQRRQREIPPAKLSKLEQSGSDEDTKHDASDDHTRYRRKDDYQGVSVDEDHTTLATHPSFSTPPLVPNRLANVRVSDSVVFSSGFSPHSPTQEAHGVPVDHTARPASMPGAPTPQGTSSFYNDSELLNGNAVRDSACANINPEGPTGTTPSASIGDRVSQTDQRMLSQEGLSPASSYWNAGSGDVEKAATAAEGRNVEEAAHSEQSPPPITLPPPPPPLPPTPLVTTATAPTRLSSGPPRQRFVTVLMEVQEDDSEEQDQPPPYQPRPQGLDVVSSSAIPTPEIP